MHNYMIATLLVFLSLATASVAAEPAKTSVLAPVATAPVSSVAVAKDAQNAPAPAPTQAPAKVKPNRAITITMFMAIIAITLGVVIWAAKRTTSAADFYAAGGGITGLQNGWAIAGDYMSAASFLGMSGLISLYGIDGFMYAVGPMFSFIAILLVVAEPCRNAGKYTLGDILSFRAAPKTVRGVAAISTVTVSLFYLIAQMVGAGKLMQVLLDIPYRFSVIGVGVLMVAYVVFGGMKATTWVQIIKAGLLMTGTVLLAFLVMLKAGMNPIGFFSDIVSSQNIQDHVRMNVLKDALPKPGFDYGQRFMEPGLFLKNPLDQISLGIAWALGAAGLPHILMRFFTVPNAKEARKSIVIDPGLLQRLQVLLGKHDTFGLLLLQGDDNLLGIVGDLLRVGHHRRDHHQCQSRDGADHQGTDGAGGVEFLPEQRQHDRREVPGSSHGKGQGHQGHDVLLLRHQPHNDGSYADEEGGDTRHPHLGLLVGLAVLDDVHVDVMGDGCRCRQH